MQEGSGDGVGRSKSWRSHVRGASALIQLRGKTNFLTPLSNRVFLGVQIGEVRMIPHSPILILTILAAYRGDRKSKTSHQCLLVVGYLPRFCA